MRFQVECFENVEAFVPFESPYRAIVTDEDFPFDTTPLRRVMNLTVEAVSSQDAADCAFEIANAPWNPTDVEGVEWDHQHVRSMSGSDVVLVHTPDGPVAYGCLSIGWKRLTVLPLSIEAALI